MHKSLALVETWWQFAVAIAHASDAILLISLRKYFKNSLKVISDMCLLKHGG